MNQRDRRALLVGGGVIVAAVLLLRVLPSAWRGWRHSREELEARRELLRHGEVLLQGLDSLEARAVDARKGLVALAPRLIAGGSEAEAQADLTGRLSLIANRERTRVLRTDALPDSTREARLRRVHLRLEVESDWSGLVGFLQGVAADPAVIRVTSIGIRGSEGSTGGGPEVMTGEVEVVGWFLERRAADGEGTGR